MNSVKILFISHRFYPDVGGTEANAEFLANKFCEYGAEVHLMTWTQSIGEKNFPFKVIRHPATGVILKEHSWADVVFENSPTLRLSWPNILYRKPLIVSLNTWLDDDKGQLSFQSKLKLKWLARAKHVIAVSDAVRQRCWNKAVVIENAYNEDLFITEEPFEARQLDFVFLGRLVSDKGADLAIQALAMLNRSNEGKHKLPFRLTVIGTGKDAADLQQLAEQSGVGDEVSFKGAMTGKKLVEQLNRHRFILVPSVWDEPFGIVVLEGMACGCIPIVSNSGGLPDAVGEAGLTFQKGNTVDLVSVIGSILENPDLQKTLREKAGAHLMAHSPDIIAKQYFKLIKSSL